MGTNPGLDCSGFKTVSLKQVSQPNGLKLSHWQNKGNDNTPHRKL